MQPLKRLLANIQFSIVWLTILVALSANAETLDQLQEIYRNLPANGEQYSELLRKEVENLASPYLKDLILGSNYAVIPAFYTALTNESDPAVLYRYVQALNDNPGTYLRFFQQMVQDVTLDHHKLARLERALEAVVGKAEMQKLKLPFGEVLPNTLLNAINMVGMSYALGSNILMKTFGYSNGTILSGLLAGYVATAVLREVYGGFRFFKNFWKARKEIKESRALSREMLILVRDFKSNRVGLDFINRMKYYTSARAKVEAAAALKEISNDYLNIYQFEQEQGMRVDNKNNNQEYAWRKMIKDFSDNLTESEKLFLRRAKSRSEDHYEIPLSLRLKMLIFESKINAGIAQWLEDNGTLENLKEYLIRVESEAQDRYAQQLKPRAAVFRFNAVLTLSMTIVGLNLAIGESPQAFDKNMPAAMIDFLRGNLQAINQISGFAVVAMFGYVFHDWVQHWRSSFTYLRGLSEREIERIRLLVFAFQKKPAIRSEIVSSTATLDGPSFLKWANQMSRVIQDPALRCERSLLF